ncbi:MAG: hypothetical protein ACRDRF_18330, partial [Pseudonocardiaceae bacterium]
FTGDDERLALLESEGALFVATARVHDLAAPVPGCPGWKLRELAARVADGTDLVPRVAADGVDEMVCGFLHRYAGQLRTDTGVTLALHATDTDGRWWIRLGPDAPTSGRGAVDTGPRDAQVEATAGELLLMLWNRRASWDLRVRGDRGALEHWQRGAHR